MAKKTPNTLTNMALSLLIVSGVAALALAAVYDATKGPIALVKQKKIEEAISVVLPEFDHIERSSMLPYDGGVDSLILYKAFDPNGELIGTAVETFTNSGFSGQFKIMVGFLPDFTIHSTALLEHKETPGLGDKMDASKSDFPEQFKGKNPAEFKLLVKKDGGDVDAITAATISSRGFCDAVDRAYQSIVSIKE
jgi:Na+-translocating ferredoxin:NAD+ oxidoreductase subunit G